MVTKRNTTTVHDWYFFKIFLKYPKNQIHTVVERRNIFEMS